MTGLPEWWNVGAEATREARRQGRGRSRRRSSHPGRGPSASPAATATRSRCGSLRPAQPRGVYLHIHGGGWVLGAADLQDPLLEQIADNTGLAVVSVEYRWRPKIPIRPDPTTANPPPPGW